MELTDEEIEEIEPKAHTMVMGMHPLEWQLCDRCVALRRAWRIKNESTRLE